MEDLTLNSVDDKYDVIIIGAGISGLTSAALLSKAGMKVLVLEQHYLIGGYLQGFERKDFIFDTAIHWLNQCGENGTVTKIFNYLGEDFPKPIPMTAIHRHIGENIDYTLTNNPNDLKNQMIQDFPHEKLGIVRFFDDAQKLAEISLKFPQLFRSSETMEGIKKIKYMIRRILIGFPMVKHVFYSGEEGMKKGLGKYFKDEKLLSFWSAEKDLLSCLFPIAWAYNNDYQNPPIGGSQVFPAWLHTKIANDYHSKIILSAHVVKIDVENDKFKSVQYQKRSKDYSVSAKYLIAACDTDVLYKKLLPQGLVSTNFLEKLDNSELYSSSVTISIALSCTAEELGFGHELVLISAETNTREEQTSGDPYKSAISVLAPSVRDKTMSPPEHGILTLYVPAWMDFENNWKTTLGADGKFQRNEEYKKLKEWYAQIVIDRVCEKLCPTLRSHILFYEVATPITYYRYSYNKNGSMMGTRPGKTNMKSKVAHYKTPVKNVIIGGQWAELGGGVPIAVKAAYNASLIVLKDHDKSAFQQLVNVMKQN
jgi:phytoene dehydrogenase-like protein